MGIDPYLIASSLNLVVAQRLVRKICEHCKEPMTLSEELLKRLRISPEVAAQTTFHQGKGCNHCGGTGYLGRMPIFEFMPISPAIREKLVSGAKLQLRAMSREKGFGGLLESGVRRFVAGATTAEEVLSVAFSDDLSE